MKAVILAGGEGVRLRPLTCERPKPMLELLGRPVLEYTLAQDVYKRQSRRKARRPNRAMT